MSTFPHEGAALRVLATILAQDGMQARLGGLFGEAMRIVQRGAAAGFPVSGPAPAHHSGPWDFEVFNDQGTVSLTADGWDMFYSQTIAEPVEDGTHPHADPEMRVANARRIVACLSALQHVPTDALERVKSPADLVEVLKPATPPPAAGLVVDPCPDAYGHWTIRVANGTENGDTEAQPIATVYSEDMADRLALSGTLLAGIEMADLRRVDEPEQLAELLDGPRGMTP